MSRFYFYTKDSELCHPLELIKEMMRLNGLKEAEVFEAKIIYGEDFMYCKFYGEVGDKGECGRDCEQYRPRNKISGNCIHTGSLYEHDKKTTIKL